MVDLLCVDETDAARTDVDVVTARESIVTVLEANTIETRTVTGSADAVTSAQVRLIAAYVALLIRVRCSGDVLRNYERVSVWNWGQIKRMLGYFRCCLQGDVKRMMLFLPRKVVALRLLQEATVKHQLRDVTINVRDHQLLC